MGLNIGVRVKKQLEEYMSYGCNPKGTREEIETEFDAFLCTKFPEGGFSSSVYLNEKDQEYTFDARIARSWNGYDSTSVYLAILEYVLNHFSADYGIDIYVYQSA